MVSEISSSEYAIDDTLSRLRNLAGNLDLWCPRDLVVTYAQHYSDNHIEGSSNERYS